MKVFNFFDNNIIKQCQFNTGLITVDHLFSLKSMSFLIGISTSSNSILHMLSENSNDICILAKKYNNSIDLLKNHNKHIILEQFRLDSNID